MWLSHDKESRGVSPLRTWVMEQRGWMVRARSNLEGCIRLLIVDEFKESSEHQNQPAGANGCIQEEETNSIDKNEEQLIK